MKKIHFEQIVCASSQKSITTGFAGFGVRSKSNGISDMEADEIFSKSDTNYQLPSEMMATEETIAANPNLEQTYPSLYTYRSIELCNGETRYIIAKTLYVGIDYGFFAQIDAARRAGTNYVANILVFNEMPEMSVFADIIKQNLFVPKNTICSPANKELCSLLVGEPTVLPDGNIDVADTNLPCTDVDFGWLIVALLEMYKNEKTLPIEQQKKVVFKIKHEKTEKILEALGTLPNDLTRGCFLQANSMLKSNVPDSFKLLIVNEKDDTIINEDYQIVIDLLGDNPRVVNVEIGHLYKQIIDCCKGNEAKTLQKLIQLFLKLNFEEEIDYPFLCLMMSLMYSSKGIGIKQLNVKTLKKITSCQLKEKTATVWNKINGAINNALVEDSNEKDVQNALECIGYILRYHAGRLSVNDESRSQVASLCFYKKKIGTLLVGNPDRLEGALCLIGPDNLPEEPIFYEALKESKNQSEWEGFIRLYYGDNLGCNIDNIVMMILQSEVTHKDVLVGALFPVEKFAMSWIDVVNENPIVAKTFPNLLSSYFETQMGNKPSETMCLYLSIKKESRDMLKDADKITNVYLNMIFKNTSKKDKDILPQIVNELDLKQSTKKLCNSYYWVLDKRPLASVDNKTMAYALINHKKQDYEYVVNLFDTWLKTKPSDQDIAAVFKEMCNTSTQIAQAFEIVWDKKQFPEAKETVLYIADKIDWSKFKREEVLNKLTNKALKEILTPKKSIFERIRQKIFKS